MNCFNVIFKGYADNSTERLRLCLHDPENDELIRDFDSRSSDIDELKVAIALCLRSHRVGFTLLNSYGLIESAQLNAKFIDPGLYGKFDTFIMGHMKENTHDFTSDYNNMIRERTRNYHASQKHSGVAASDVIDGINDMEPDSDAEGMMEDREDVEMFEQISKTGAFPIDSCTTLELTAMCSCLVNRNWDLSAQYFKALMLYISRRHDLHTRKQYEEFTKPIHSAFRQAKEHGLDGCEIFDEISSASILAHIAIAKDIVMLWIFYRICLLATHQGALLPLVDPASYIYALQSTRPLFVISDAEYSKQLAESKTAFQVVMRFVVYGQEDPDRMEECRSVFHTFEQNEKGFKYSKTRTESFFRWCFLSNKRKIAFSLHTDLCHAGFQEKLDVMCYEHGEKLVSLLTVDETYCERYVRALPLDKPVIALRAACGTGKSVQMLKHIDLSDQNMAFVIVSHRKALSAEMQKRTRQTSRGPFVLYNEVDGKIDLNVHKNVICEFESLSRLLPFNGKFCVIIDEANSVLNQTQSTAGDTQAAHAVFINLIHLADRVLIMDAFLDQDRIKVWSQYVKYRPYVIENTFKPNSDHKVWCTRNKYTAKQKLISLIEQGENIIVPCAIKADAEEIYHLVCSLIDSQQVQLYTSEKRWRDGDDVNEVWSKARVVIHTSTMDSGHSFELDHFGWAICFFSNQVAIPVEASLQMKARSRLTKNFIINIEQQYTTKHSSHASIDEIIADIYRNKRQMAETSCRLYYGEKGYWNAFRDEENPVCPFLVLYATVKLLRYRSTNSFGRLLYEMLREDGVKAENINNLDENGHDIQEAVKNARQQAKENAKVPTSLTLAEIYSFTPIGIFDAMEDEHKRFYGSTRVIKAYRNRIAFHSEGPDLINALQNLKKKQECLISAIAVCRSKNCVSKDSLIQTEIQLGLHRGDDYRNTSTFVACGSIGCDLSEIFTGEINPFDVGQINSSKLREHLCCTLRTSNDSSSYKIYEIDASLSKNIEDMYSTYLVISKKNGGCQRRNGRPLSLTEGISLLNNVLQDTFGIRLQRNANLKVKYGTDRECIYEINDLFSFDGQMIARPGSKQKKIGKPLVTTWNNVVAEICDEDILR